MTEEKKYEGLGGWLILVGLGIVISPFKIAAEYLPMYLDLFSSGDYEVLSSPESEYYTPGYSLLLYSELLLNCLLALAWICVAFLFFTKRKLFKNFYIGILLFTFCFILSDSLAVNIVFPDEPVFDKVTIVELSRIAIISAIWIPYVLVSKRVKATFVR